MAPARATPGYDAFAVAAPGLEPLVAAELRGLGASQVTEAAGGVGFRADMALLARANLELRVASRVLVRLAAFRATAFHELERAARKVEWARVLALGTAFAVRATCRKSRLYHSAGVAQRVAGAIERAVPQVTGVAPGSDADDATEAGDADVAPQLIVVRLDHDRCTVSVDSSGALLHRRGYRQAIGKAPLRETLAAAVLMGAGYDPAHPLVDPMCGSGTIAIEAALLARGIAPGSARRFAAETWPEAAPAAWASARAAAHERVTARALAPIVAADRDAGAIAAARANAARAGVERDIEFRVAPLSALEPPAGRGLVAVNPPYGVRVGESKALRDLFARLGQVAAVRLRGWRVALLSADRALEAQVRLRFEERFRTRNGGIPVRLVVAEVPPSE